MTPKTKSSEVSPGWPREARSLFERTPAAILVFDEKLQYLDANPAAEALLQRSKAEIVGRCVGDFSDYHDGARLAHRLLAAHGQSIFEENLRLRLPDGSTRNAKVLTQPDMVPGVHVSFLRDVTDEQQLRRDLEHHSRLEAIGKVAGGVAHDVNNMLTAILSYADLQLQSKCDASVKRYAMGIQAAAERAAETTRELLAFCRKQSVKLSEVVVNDVIRDTSKLAGRLIGENIQIVLELEPDLPTVLGDSGQLSQVLMNLAVNARDAMPAGGSIAFATSQREVRSHDNQVNPGRYVVISVRDTGSGIRQEVLPHIFDPFFTTKEAGNGTGLGLATVYGIVKQSKGHIEVRSELGRGTTFEILLPAGTYNAKRVTLPVSAEFGLESPMGAAHHSMRETCEF